MSPSDDPGRVSSPEERGERREHDGRGARGGENQAQRLAVLAALGIGKLDLSHIRPAAATH